MFGSWVGFALEVHVERDPGLLCVDIFAGGLHVNSWDNAFYPPLLVKKNKDELGRLAEGAPGYQFLEWGECTDEVLVFAEATGGVWRSPNASGPRGLPPSRRATSGKLRPVPPRFHPIEPLVALRASPNVEPWPRAHRPLRTAGT